jgi:hypothetical protein
MSSPAPKPLGVNSNAHVRRLRIERIRLGSQPQDNLIEECVIAYRDRMRYRAKIDPVLVYFDGENYFLKDGFQRIEAALRLGRKTILAEVIPGTRAGMAAEWKRFLAALKFKPQEKSTN